MLKRFIEWLEGDIARGRKVVLISTVYVFLFVTIGLFAAGAYGIIMSEMVPTLYITFVGLVSVVYAFYTSTSSAKSSQVADKAADLMMEELKKLQDKIDKK